jgi:hypothetical protein
MQNGGEMFGRENKAPPEWNSYHSDHDQPYMPQQMNNNNSGIYFIKLIFDLKFNQIYSLPKWRFTYRRAVSWNAACITNDATTNADGRGSNDDEQS